MRMNRSDLKKVQYDYNCISSRLLRAHVDDYNNVLKMFLEFLDSIGIISAYIIGCGECEQDIAQEFKKVSGGYGRYKFDLGITEKEEVRNVYAILKYIVSEKALVHYSVGRAYSSAKKNNDVVRDFNDRVVMVLIRHIEQYLTKIGIDMGMDDKIVYSITVNNGQANIATDNATIVAANTIRNGVNTGELIDLLNAAFEAASRIDAPKEEIESVQDDINMIREQMSSKSPNKNRISKALQGIKKFFSEVVIKVAAAAAAKSIVEFDWTELIEKIETIVQ